MKGKIEYDISQGKRFVQVRYEGVDLSTHLTRILQRTQILIPNAFNQNTRQIILPPEIKLTCIDVFEAIKLVKQEEDEELAAYLAARLFEAFTPYWRISLLSQGRELWGTYLWKAILNITTDWEKANGNTIKIHTGTPNFFLSENYFLLGDRDLAFVYLYDALEDDKLLNTLAPSFNYPADAPARRAATMNPNPNNHMYFIVEELRNRLQDNISKFNAIFSINFTIDDFDHKFLRNTALRDVVEYFVYNFIFLLTIENHASARQLNNDFSRLRALDLFFNFCLVIDETLKVLYGSRNAGPPAQLNISYSIIWFCCNLKAWIRENDLTCYWGDVGIKLNDSAPDNVIPQLLAMNESWKGHRIRNEIYPFLITYKFRNYGGHRISQQQVISREFVKIIEQLMFTLFLVVREL